jgi:uncharacterized membrane protein
MSANLPPGSVARRPRITSVDTLRGLVMVLMALDHVRDFFGVPGINPVNLSQTTMPLFFTRWLTHICAPTFFLLTGTGAWLSRRPRAELSRFLVTRGLWLLVLEVTVVRCLGLQFNLDYQVTGLIVIWALGWAMIALAGLVWLPAWAIATVAVVMIVGHNALDGIRSTHPLWVFLHTPGLLVNEPGFVVFVAYPIVPWIGVTALGYCLGQIFEWDPVRRRSFLLRAGLATTIAFVALRLANTYGDPAPWSTQASTIMTAVSFLNTTKYPPSLLFLLMTLGPALLLLRAFERCTPRWLAPPTVFGRVPLFYFVLHFFLIHLLAAIVCAWIYGTPRYMMQSPDLGSYPFTVPPGWGFSLPVVYGVWVAVVAMLYPVCAAYAAVKRDRASRWLSYL